MPTPKQDTGRHGLFASIVQSSNAKIPKDPKDPKDPADLKNLKDNAKPSMLANFRPTMTGATPARLSSLLSQKPQHTPGVQPRLAQSQSPPGQSRLAQSQSPPGQSRLTQSQAAQSKENALIARLQASSPPPLRRHTVQKQVQKQVQRQVQKQVQRQVQKQVQKDACVLPRKLDDVLGPSGASDLEAFVASSIKKCAMESLSKNNVVVNDAATEHVIKKTFAPVHGPFGEVECVVTNERTQVTLATHASSQHTNGTAPPSDRQDQQVISVDYAYNAGVATVLIRLRCSGDTDPAPLACSVIAAVHAASNRHKKNAVRFVHVTDAARGRANARNGATTTADTMHDHATWIAAMGAFVTQRIADQRDGVQLRVVRTTPATPAAHLTGAAVNASGRIVRLAT